MIPTKTINLDFWRHPTDILHLVQGEADGRKIQFKITDNGSPADLTGFIAIFAIRKPDGNVVVNSATITEAELGIVETTISSQVVTTAGNAHAELHLMKEGQLSKSFRIVTKVAPGVDIDGIAPSVSEFNALQTLIGQAETVISIADTELWPEVVANAQYFSDLAGVGRTTETVKGNADEIADVAGVGRTTETVKGNADEIADLTDDLANLAGAGRTTETVKGAADAVTNLAGAGRNTETVKANADEIAAVEAEIETARDGAATLGARIGILNDRSPILLADKTYNEPWKTGTLSADVATSTFTLTGHGFVLDKVVEFQAGTGALPDGILAHDYDGMGGEYYYIVNPQTNTFQVSLTRGGAPVAFSSAGTVGFQIRNAAFRTLGSALGTSNLHLYDVYECYSQFMFVGNLTPGLIWHDQNVAAADGAATMDIGSATGMFGTKSGPTMPTITQPAKFKFCTIKQEFSVHPIGRSVIVNKAVTFTDDKTVTNVISATTHFFLKHSGIITTVAQMTEGTATPYVGFRNGARVLVYGRNKR